jgi:hypothetical protein
MMIGGLSAPTDLLYFQLTPSGVQIMQHSGECIGDDLSLKEVLVCRISFCPLGSSFNILS